MSAVVSLSSRLLRCENPVLWDRFGAVLGGQADIDEGVRPGRPATTPTGSTVGTGEPEAVASQCGGEGRRFSSATEVDCPQK